MIKGRILRILSLSLLICSAFILCTALGMLLKPEAFHKFFSPVQLVPDLVPPSLSRNYYWDVRSYAEMVLSNRCLAFYPLWPLLTRFLFNPQTLEQAAHSLLKLSTVIFFISSPLLVWVFLKNLKEQKLTILILIAFSVSPMAIFRVIGYTESLFTLLSVIFIWLCMRPTQLNNKIQLGLLFIVTFLLSLNRPILIQSLIASIASLATIIFFDNLKLPRERRDFLSQINQHTQKIQMTVVLWTSAILGFSAYGIYCLHSRGNFLAPFIDQKYWSTKTGLHLELIFFPKSPLFDLLGLYFPILVLGISLFVVYCKVKNENPLVWVPKSPIWNVLILYPPLLVISYIVNYFRLKNKSANGKSYLTRLNTSDFTETLSNNYIFWFCAYFSVVHCALIFFTRDRLYSLGRHIFGVPFFFLALGYLCCCIPGKKTYQALWWFIIISAIALVEQWVNYGQNKWLG